MKRESRRDDPCRRCTDRAVCRGGCVKATAYIKEARRELAEAMKRRKEDADDQGSVQALRGGAEGAR